MGIGGTSSANHNSNPMNMYSPVAFDGGSIIAGNVGTGSVSLSGDSKAEGGKFDAKLDLNPMDSIPGMGGGKKEGGAGAAEGGAGGAAGPLGALGGLASGGIPALPQIPGLPGMGLQNLDTYEYREENHSIVT